MIDILCEVKHLLDKLDMGHMRGVAYDTAWVARIEDGCGKPVFPQALNWVLNNQKKDGSWGSEIEYYHDRVISTLVSLLALTQYKVERNRIKQGEDYIWNNIDNLINEPYETIGFELILPTLMDEAEKKHLNLPYHKNRYEKLREEKLKLIPKDLIYSSSTTVGYSIEFLGDCVDPQRIASVQTRNGSMLNSPSATAYLICHSMNPKSIVKAYEYLFGLMSYCSGSFMTLYPFELYEIPFVLNNFVNSGLFELFDFSQFVNRIWSCWSNDGIGLASTFPIPDLDDTAVAFKILHLAGFDVDPKVFERFETDNHFLCYPFERNPSITANVHTLDAIKSCSDYSRRDQVIEKVLKYLKKNSIDNCYWSDKYAVSPYYNTSHAIIAICDLDATLTGKAVDWLIRNQNDNGSWGVHGGTPEETAFVLQALVCYHSNIEKIDITPIFWGGLYLEKNRITKQNPELWVGKCLYAPTNVIRSIIIGGFYSYKFGIDAPLDAIVKTASYSEKVVT